VYTTASAVIDSWRSRLSGQETFSASEVQDRLFDLYGELAGGPLVELIKPWLTLTRQRELFGARELEELLDEVVAAISVEPAGAPDQLSEQDASALAEQAALTELASELSEPVA
jgi:hypothetical protein